MRLRSTIWFCYGLGLIVALAFFMLMLIGAFLLMLQEALGPLMWMG